MTKRMFALVSTLVTCDTMASIAIVTYFNPSCAEAVNASISIAEGAVIAICSNFVKEV